MGHIVNMRKTKREKNYDNQADWLEVAINSSWKRTRLNLWRILNPIYQKMGYAKFACNWPWGSGEIFFLNVVRVLSSYHDKVCGRSFEHNWVEEVYFSYFAIISPRM